MNRRELISHYAEISVAEAVAAGAIAAGAVRDVHVHHLPATVNWSVDVDVVPKAPAEAIVVTLSVESAHATD